MAENELVITYARLKKYDGEWGIKVKGGKLSPGDVVDVMTMAGKSKKETVAEMVAEFEDAIYYRIKRHKRQGK